MKFQKVQQLFLLLALGAFASSAHAATATATLNVTANVVPTCTISTNSLDFGMYDGSSTLTNTGFVNVNCTLGTAATVTLGQGTNPAVGSTDDAPLRRLYNGTTYIPYFLYRDSGHTQIWGNTSATGEPTTGTGSAVVLTVFGTLPSGTTATAGAYSDAVVATVTW